MAPVCKFWLQGTCRFGNQCRYEHPVDRETVSHRNSSPFTRGNEQGQSQPNATQHARQHHDQRGRQSRAHNSPLPYNLNVGVVKTELSDERPMWILSAFGPGTNAPAQLFGGLPREQSFEEMRVRHYELAARGESRLAIEEAQKLHNTAADQIRVALQDIDGAIDYIVSAEKNHPNRLDVCRKGTQSSAGSFSRETAIHHAKSSRFGAPESFQPSSVFPRPSAPTTGFGQPSHNTGNTDHVQPSNSAPNPFARASTSGPMNPFIRAQGVPSTSGGGFGPTQSSEPQKVPFTPFGMTSGADTAMQSPSRTNPFANTGLNTRSNAEPASRTASTPKSSGGFDQSSIGQGAWGRVLDSQARSDSFIGNGASQAATGLPVSNKYSLEVQRDMSGRITSWARMPVSYPDGPKDPCIRRSDGQFEKIWFPDGPPERTMPQDIPIEYYSEYLEQDYKYLTENGKFRDGEVPQFPPKWEWTSWDF